MKVIAVGRLKSKRIAPIVFLVSVTSIAYVNADHEEFFFDSASKLNGSPILADDVGNAVDYFWKAPFLPGSRLTSITFALNHAFNVAAGLKPFDVTSYLIVNVLIHALNACLVYFLICSLLRLRQVFPFPTMWVALMAATLFAVHPLHASSVVYIFQRRGTLATTFLLLAVLAYLRVRRGWSYEQEERLTTQKAGFAPHWSGKRVALAATIPVCYWFSFSSKQLGLVLPFLLSAIELCLCAPDRAALKKASVWMIPMVVFTIAGVLVFLWTRSLFDPINFRLLPWGSPKLWGPWTQFLTESRAFVHYWKLLLLPLPRWCCIDHGFATSAHLTEHYAFVAITFHGILLGLAVLAAWKRYTLAAIGIFWFYIGLIPYAVIPQADLLVEYETYLPSIGLALIVTEGLIRLRGRMTTPWQVAAVGAVAVCLLVTTISRNVIYHSPFNLWSDAVEKSPNQARAHNNLAVVLFRQGRADDAIRHYRESLRINPDYVEAQLGLAITLSKQGRLDEAFDHYEESLRINPDYAEAHYNLANDLFGQRKLDPAVEHYREAVRLAPDFAEARYNLANVLVEQDRMDEAVQHYQHALRIRPDFPECSYNLGDTLVRLGRLDEAIEKFREALRLRPDDASIHYVLGLVLSKQKRMGEAIAEYQNVLRIDPHHVEARQQLEAALALHGR